jgi:hypothetical protein
LLFAIDSPQIGTTITSPAASFSGWVGSTEVELSMVRVVDKYQVSHIVSELTIPRKDVRSSFPMIHGDGDLGFCFELALFYGWSTQEYTLECASVDGPFFPIAQLIFEPTKKLLLK